jgi:succinate dehydrogenase hydrophobic anchor subunit
MDLVGEQRLKLMVFAQFFVMLVSALLGCHQMIEGVSDVFKKRFTCNTMLVFAFVLCCLDGVLGLQQQRVPCCAAFTLAVTMSLW